MSIKDRLAEFWRRHGNVTDAEPVWFGALAPEQIGDPQPRAVAGVPVQPGVHYVTLAVRRMNLRTEQFLAKKKFPVVHSQVVLDSGGSTLTVPAVAGHDKVGELDLAAGVVLAGTSYPLFSRLPYHEGSIEVVAGVVSMNGDDAVTRLTRVVNRVTEDLLPPALSSGAGAAVRTGLNLTAVALDCVDDLFGHGDAEVVLGMHAVFAPEIGERPVTGLYVLLNAGPAEDGPSGLDSLVYQDDELWYRKADGSLVHLRGCDWMVLELGALTHRPYSSFAELRGMVAKAVRTLPDNEDKAVALLNAAITTAFESNDIVRSDLLPVVKEMTDLFEAAALQVGVKLEQVREPAAADTWDDGELAGGAPSLVDFLVRVS